MQENIITTEQAKNIQIDELLNKLSTTDKGISNLEASNRLQKYGPNEISEKKKNPFIKFLKNFWGPIPWMIEIAAILSAIIDHWDDFIIIIILLLLNAVVRFWEEHKADNAIELLKEKLALRARVLRDGEWQDIEARDLVPGDMLRLRLGDIVPADSKIICGDYLLTDESALTGESLPVEKHVEDISYSSSIIRQGEVDAIVVTTGMNTYFGKTTKMIEEAEKRSHFQKAVMKIGNFLIIVAVFLVILIFFVAMFRQESIAETLQFALVLIVAAIPVALPAVLSVTMAIGATSLAKKEAIVSRLVAIEEMAGMDVLCSDKTGTITKNELSVAELTHFDSYTDEDVLLLATLASREEDQDPIDNAIITKFKTLQSSEKLLKPYKVTAFKPFDPVAKRTEAKIEDNTGKIFNVSKGAPQVILSLLANDEAISTKINEIINTYAHKGYRTLGLAKTDSQGNWEYIGLIPLYDPPREDSKETIDTAKSMGVDVKMVTGDHIAIAKEVALQVDLETNMVPISSFIDKPDNEAQRIVETANGFAQVFPEHKFHIVDLLQNAGHIVGMTGDGVNDAPALKKADAGIAVANATDAAKSAADIVLTRPGLSVIIDSIKESRKIFQRMNNYSLYRIAETIRVLLFMTVSIIVFNFYPVTAIMIVLLALLNDAPIMTIAYDNVTYSNEPERWNMRMVLMVSTFLGIIGVGSSFGIFYIAQVILHLPKETIQSFIYLKLSVAGHLTLFVARTRGPFWSIKPSKILFFAVVITQTIATFITVYGFIVSPIGWILALFVWIYALVLFVLTDLLKVGLYKLIKRRKEKS